MTDRKHRQSLYKDPRWFRLRKAQLKQMPWCAYCLQIGQRTKANVVDHIIRHRGRPELFFSRNNLQSLCHTCHNSAKHKEERRGAPIGATVDGNPRDPNHPWNK